MQTYTHIPTERLPEFNSLLKQLQDTKENLRSFEEAKSLLFQSDYQLESSVPQFITQNLEISSKRDEKYKEDFWLLNDDGQAIIIAEVKSIVKGFKRSAIFSLYNHREANSLETKFPALLVVNCNLQAGSWKDKDRPIDKQDVQIAAQNNILIVRVEDLLRLWDLKRSNGISTEKIVSLLTSESGWLQVDSELKIKVNK